MFAFSYYLAGAYLRIMAHKQQNKDDAGLCMRVRTFVTVTARPREERVAVKNETAATSDL